MIRSYKDKRTETVAQGTIRKGFPADILRRSMLLLNVLNTATRLSDLRSPPGNRLEQLSGDRAGQHSIRINGQFRICFRWTDAGPEDVEITDYH